MPIEKHIDGRRFSKREVTTFLPDEGDTEEEEASKRHEFFKKEGKVVGNKIVMGEKFDVSLKNIIAATELFIQQDTSGDLDRDSELDLAKRILLNAKVALNDNNKIFSRLEFAFKLGKDFQQLKTYRIESNEKSNNSSGIRNWPELDEWLNRTYEEDSNWTYYALWQAIPKVSVNEDFGIDENDNLIYLGNGKTKRKSMKFASFQKYMAEYKKRS